MTSAISALRITLITSIITRFYFLVVEMDFVMQFIHRVESCRRRVLPVWVGVGFDQSTRPHPRRLLIWSHMLF